MLTGLELVTDLLRCPRCRQSVGVTDRRLVCAAGHSFDVARQGYVNLLAGGAPAHADTAAMVAARSTFLGAGHYDPVVAAVPVDPAARVIIDAGAGPGHHLARVLDRAPQARGLAVDISVPAGRRAARAHPRLAAVVADVWRELPVGDAVADLIMVVFAPRNLGEFARVLRRGGRLVVVTPEADHLQELVRAADLMTVEPAKTDRLRRDAAPWFEIAGSTTVRFALTLTAEELGRVVQMGPNAFHLDPATLAERLVVATGPADDGLVVTVACTVTDLRRHDPIHLG